MHSNHCHWMTAHLQLNILLHIMSMQRNTSNIWNNTKNSTWNHSSPLIQPSLWKMLKEAEYQCWLQLNLLHSEHPQHFQLSLYLCSAIKMQIKDNSVRWHFLCSADMPHRRQYAQQQILRLKLPTLKYHQCTAPKIMQDCAKNYTRYFHIKTLSEFLFTYKVLKHDKWCSIFCWEQAHSLHLCDWRETCSCLSPWHGWHEEIQLHSFLISVVNGCWQWTSHPMHSNPQHVPQTCMEGGWVGHNTSLGISENRKIFCPWEALNPLPSSCNAVTTPNTLFRLSLWDSCKYIPCNEHSLLQ